MHSSVEGSEGIKGHSPTVETGEATTHSTASRSTEEATSYHETWTEGWGTAAPTQSVR